MRLSDFSDYSLRVLMFAALQHPGQGTIGAMTKVFGISRNHLVKVVHHLGRLGYLRTQRGVGGGFSLAQPPEDIRLDAVIRKTESNLDLVECFTPSTNYCRLIGNCRLRGALLEAREAFFASLRKRTLADLVQARQPMKDALGL